MINNIIEKAKKENKKVYIYAHKFPDMDALSSSISLRDFLREKGIDANYIVTEDVRNFGEKILGKITPYTPEQVEDDQISIVVDTSTEQYAQNDLFKKSSKENIFVIDHHEKAEGTQCIEDTLELSSDNYVRDSSASSAAEIIANLLDKQKELNSDLATKLCVGLVSDTAEFRYIKENSLSNFDMLLKNGADYELIKECNSYKTPLSQQVGLSKILLNTKHVELPNGLNLNYLALNNKTSTYLASKYGLNHVEKKIFSLGNIENACANMVVAENELGIHSFEFRGTPYGNPNVQKIAAEHGGGGHYSASGCNVESTQNNSIVADEMFEELKTSCLEQTKGYNPIEFDEKDKQLKELLDYTDRFSKNLDSDVLNRIQELKNSGANYQLIYDEKVPFKEFMLKNEIFSRVPDNQLGLDDITIDITKNDLKELNEKYNLDLSESDLLNYINVFKKENVKYNTVKLNVNNKVATIDADGMIKKENDLAKEDDISI